MITIVCIKNIKTDDFSFYQSIESLFDNVSGIKCHTRYGEKDATIDWVKAEIAENGVASIHTIKPAVSFCGVDFPAEIEDFVVSYMEVK